MSIADRVVWSESCSGIYKPMWVDFMRYKFWMVILLLMLLSLSSFAQSEKGQDQSKEVVGDETIRIDASLVNVPIVASNKDGRYIPDLKSEDFLLYENGAKQEISNFSSE